MTTGWIFRLPEEREFEKRQCDVIESQIQQAFPEAPH
jgi:hypothetical protein